MRLLRKQGGVTLVELVIVLAISALLIGGAIAGTAAVRQGTSFAAAIDQVRNQIRGVQNEAQQAVSQIGSSTNAGKTGQTFFGQVIEFQDGTTTGQTNMTVSTLIQDPANPTTSKLMKCDTHTITFQSGLLYSGDRRAIIFTRNPAASYIAPTDYSEVPDVGASCTPPADAAPVTPPAATTDCPPGQTFVRTVADPLGTCNGVSNSIPPAPTVTTDAPSGYTKSHTVKVTVTGSKATNILTLYTHSGLNYTGVESPHAADGGANSYTFTYTFPANTAPCTAVNFTAIQTGGAEPSPYSTPDVSVIYYEDTTPCPIYIDSPANNASISGPDVTFKIRGVPGSLAQINIVDMVNGAQVVPGVVQIFKQFNLDANGRADVKIRQDAYGQHVSQAYQLVNNTQGQLVYSSSNLVYYSNTDVAPLIGGLVGYYWTPDGGNYTNTFTNDYPAYGVLAGDMTAILKTRIPTPNHNSSQNVQWTGYIVPTATSSGRLCDNVDDNATVTVFSNDGTQLATITNTGANAPTIYCSSNSFTMTAGQRYRLYVSYQNDCRPVCAIAQSPGDGAVFNIMTDAYPGGIPQAWYYHTGSIASAPSAFAPGDGIGKPIAGITVPIGQQVVTEVNRQTLAQKVMGALVPSAHAAVATGCDKNILNPLNYSAGAGCFGATSEVSLPFKDTGGNTGNVKINHDNNSVRAAP